MDNLPITDLVDTKEPPLLAIIHELLDTHALLETALLNEKAMLTSLDIEAMLQVGQEKQKMLGKIAQLERSLMDCLSLSSSYTLRQKVEETISQEPSSNRSLAEKNWRELIALVKRCKDLNKVNAAIVQASLSHNRKKLNILNSMTNTGIYDDKGIIS